VEVPLSKQLPDSAYITAVQAVCWLGFGDALSVDEIAKLEGEQWENVLKKAKQGERLLFEAHIRGDVGLIGRRRNTERPEVLSDREPIPKTYFADKVAVNLRTNQIEPDAAVEFREFERNQRLTLWEDVVVATSEVSVLAGANVFPTEMTHTGAPGRPRASHLIEAEFSKRVSEGAVLPTLAEQARALREWQLRELDKTPPLTEKTIKNRIRKAYRDAKAQN
jgi:hypothetical protein